MTEADVKKRLIEMDSLLSKLEELKKNSRDTLEYEAVKRDLKTVHEKLKYIPPEVDLLKLDITEIGKTPLNILNRATSALTEFEQLEERRRRELNEKVIVFAEKENTEQANFKKTLDVHMQSFAVSLRKIYQLLTKKGLGDPSKLRQQASKNDQEFRANVQELQQEYEKCKFPPKSVDLVKLKIEVESKELNAVSILHQATLAMANIEQLKLEEQKEELDEKHGSHGFQQEKDDEALARRLQAEEDNPPKDENIAKYLELLELVNLQGFEPQWAKEELDKLEKIIAKEHGEETLAQLHMAESEKNVRSEEKYGQAPTRRRGP